jgi:hypothetical protein
MKVKVGENIPARLAGALATLGHDVDTVASEGLDSFAGCFVVLTNRKLRARWAS